ncbi:MAG TPA: cation transporter [Acidimicrobiales bacterium]|nr:cation transporter [Acidimicrobiales bacterium]
MASQTFVVTGMTCDHCKWAVTTELRRLDGVTDVDVDLGTGTVTVAASRPLDRAELAAAIDEAGYELAS